MKVRLSFLALVLVLACIGVITVLSALHDPVPVVFAGVALGGLSGQLALLRLPSGSPFVVAIVLVVAIGILAGLHVAVPTVLVGLLIAALTGHYALSLPDPAAGPPAPVEVPQPVATAPPPQPPASAPGSSIAGA
jgi:hypothetical protein